MEKDYMAGGLRFNCIDNPNAGYVNADLDVTRNIEVVNGVPTVRKRGRRKKEDKPETKLALAADKARGLESSENKPDNIMTNDAPVYDKYNDTNNALKQTVVQMEILAGELKTELDNVRTMKSSTMTAKVKYDAISGLGSTIGQLLRSKVDAIKEMNRSITEANNMEIKRFKEIGERNAEKSSEERVMELYNAYINMPVGSYTGPQFPTTIDATTGQVSSVGMAPPGVVPMINVTPEMNRMLLDGNPNIATVVINDPVTGEYKFDVIDRTTMQSVPNYPRPSQMILEGLTINPNTGVAVNKDYNLEYDVINRPSIPEYETDPNAAQAIKDMQNNDHEVQRSSAKNSF